MNYCRYRFIDKIEQFEKLETQPRNAQVDTIDAEYANEDHLSKFYLIVIYAYEILDKEEKEHIKVVENLKRKLIPNEEK